jgi:hypothetical protein
MSCHARASRPFVLAAIALAVALILAPVPTQARESAPAGWFDALTHQIQQWTASWWTWPAHETAPAQVKSHPAGSSWRPRIRPQCNGAVGADGQCL